MNLRLFDAVAKSLPLRDCSGLGRQVEKLLAVMFGAAPGDGAGKPDAAQFILSFAQLRADVNAYAKIARSVRSSGGKDEFRPVSGPRHPLYGKLSFAAF